MQKLNNFIYMIASAIVANMAYVMGGVQNAAHAAARCSYVHPYRYTGWRYGSNLAQCSDACAVLAGWGNGLTSVYYDGRGTCSCYISISQTAYGTWQDESINCGRRSTCLITYKTCDNSLCPEQYITSYGMPYCNSDNYPGYGGYMVNDSQITTAIVGSCACCPCFGNDPKGESCLGSQNSAPYASMIKVVAAPGATSFLDCYMIGNAYDPTGLYEYTDTDKCYYKPTATIPVPGGSVVPVPGGTVAPVGPSASSAK